MKTEINITKMEDIGRSEIQEKNCCTIGLQEMGFKCLKAPAKWIQMEVTTPLLPGHLLQVFVRQWQKERSWSPILTKHIDIATGAAKKK